MVKVTDPDHKKTPNKPDNSPDDRLGLPTPVMVYKDDREDKLEKVKTWNKLDESGITMTHDTVVCPSADEDGLSAIYVNMDSKALLKHCSSLKTAEAIEIAKKRYFSAVYFHTLFLYVITKNRKYFLRQEEQDSGDKSVELVDYISDLFTNAYAEFLLNFDTQELINTLEA